MKKIIATFILIILIVTVLCSCNQGLGIGNLEFTHLHYDTHHDSGCIDIDKWYDNSSGIEVLTTDGTAIFFSEGTYTLIDNKGNCPFCG